MQGHLRFLRDVDGLPGLRIGDGYLRRGVIQRYLHHGLVDALVAAYHHQAQGVKPIQVGSIPLGQETFRHRRMALCTDLHPCAWVKPLAVFQPVPGKIRAGRAAADFELGAPVRKHFRRADMYVRLHGRHLESVIGRGGCGNTGILGP